ncbi:MAG: YiiX/YebB-like N1pC/P60 family cysteine hydrolase [Pseudomonadota bacterium]
MFKSLISFVILVNLSYAQAAQVRPLGDQGSYYVSIIEQNLVWRSQALEKLKGIHEKIHKDEPLNAKDLEVLYRGAENYIRLRRDLWKIIDLEKVVLTLDKRKIIFSPGEGSSLSKKVRRVDPFDEQGREWMLEIKRGLAAALTLCDNFLYIGLPLYATSKTRRLLSSDYDKIEGMLHEIAISYTKIDNQRLLQNLLTIFESEQLWRQKNQVERSGASDELYLENLIHQSPSRGMVMKRDTPGAVGRNISRQFLFFKDDLNGVLTNLTFVASKGFGNTAGLVAFRQGLLRNMPSVDQDKLATELKPLDLLLEKTPFRLTDKFIPGHFGHVAVWTGSESELKEMGVWDDPVVQPYQEAIRNGRRIIEALRPGVQINTLQHFLDIDDLMVLRNKLYTPEQRKVAIIKAFKQIGKEYDFNFDVETDKRIVCSEIAYVVYTDSNWETEKMLGRSTICPDNVANLARSSVEFEPVILYHAGVRAAGDLREKMVRLLDSQEIPSL